MQAAGFSDFEQRVLQTACSKDPCSTAAFEQLRKAVVVKRKFTGCGVFVDFATDGSGGLIEASGRTMPGANRIYLSHPNLDYGADIIVWLNEGIMDCLEMVTFGDGTWPETEDGFVIEVATEKQ